MNPSQALPLPFRRLILAPACAIIAVSFSWAQQAPAPEAAPIPAKTASAGSEETIRLSPFEVKAEANGYYSPNTMSGTRINANIQDLASSITVVSKTQMQDFALLDVNDIFLYVGNTEGTGTYTAGTGVGVADRNGSVQDNVQVDPINSNRIRGIAPANFTLNNIQTMGRVPIDPIDIESIEISRGPNANVFGLGNPSGTVNLVPVAANLTRSFNQMTERADSYGGYRSTLDVNRVLWENKLAIRVSGVFQHDGYIRKPSGENTVKYNGYIKFRPFKGTTISASVNYYRLNGNRPNYLPPRDNISYWIRSGMPTWDPTTQQVHLNGVTVGTFTSTTYNGPDYFSATLLGGSHSQMFIDQNGLSYWSAPQAFNNTSALLAGTTVKGPTSGGQADRFLQTTGTAGATGTAAKPSAQPLFVTTPTISDKSVYDWSSINLSAPNRLMDRTITSNVAIEQEFLNTGPHLLVGQVAFMREDSQRYQRNLLGIANTEGQSGQLEVDINEKLLDGTPNPYFLRPFIATDKPRTAWYPQKWDTYRAQLAYQLDLTEQKGLLKWLGKQQLTGYDEYKYQISRSYTYREAMVDPKPWLQPGLYRSYQAAPAGTPANVGLTNGLLRYYVGDNQGTNVDYAPFEFVNQGVYNFVWGRAATSTLPAVWNNEPTTLGLAAADKSGGTFNTKQIIKTVGAVLQSHLLADDLVVTLGTREDRVYSKFGNMTAAGTVPLAADGINFDYGFINSWQAGDYAFNGGKTTNVQYVLRPFRDLSFIKTLDDKGGADHVFANVLHGLSLNYNQASSFIAATPAQDLYLRSLPNPRGTDKSHGLSLDLFDGKVVVRVDHYDTLQKDIRNGDANTTAQRVIRTDLLLQGATPARFVLQNVAGGTTASFGPNNNQYGWIKATNPTFTDQQVFDEFSKEIGLSETEITALMNPTPPIAATNDIAARGTEVEVYFNPTRNWTMSVNFTDMQSYIKNVSSTLQEWINQRMPIWTTLVDPTITASSAASDVDVVTGIRGNPNHLWWIHNYGGTQTAQANFIAFVQTPYSVIKQLEGQADPQTRRYGIRLATTYRLAGITDNKIFKNLTVGGAVRWESPGAIGFWGVPDANGIYQTLDVSKPIYDKAHTYVDLVFGYKLKLFGGRVPTTIQLNVRNVTEGGRLQPIGAYPDGTIDTYRIIDPRLFILSATFDM
ncbi:MAG TPA: TonB-dependent receptor plug domain-containing protein [Opitutaceae bacterium]|nr:TonB-dependent receptor plug domain-containing protein [Opitutaceae bacterium]